MYSENSPITTTEWDFHIDGTETIKIYTMPFITAKARWRLNKLYKPAFEKQMLDKMNSQDFIDVLISKKINLKDLIGDGDSERQKTIIAGFLPLLLEAKANEQAMELYFDFDEAIEFCLMCIDRQRILKEFGREILDKVLDEENWVYQPDSLVTGIINQYSFRPNEIGNVSDAHKEDIQVLPIH